MIKKSKRLFAFSKYGPMGASSRMRTYNYTPFFKSKFEVTNSALFSDDYIKKLYSNEKVSPHYIVYRYIRQFVFFIKALFCADIIWIEKELFPYIPLPIEVLIKIFGKKLVLDYDDAIYHNYSSSKFSALFKWKFGMIARYADIVLCGNRIIEDYMKERGSCNTRILPTVIDADKYCINTIEVNTSKIVVGWIGTPKTQKFLTIIDDVIKQLQLKYEVELRVIGGNDSHGLNSKVTIVPWSDDSEVVELNKIDIGIMPLFDGDFERGKCGYKLIQYMALAKPVLASPVGVNESIIEEGINGMLCADSKQWYTNLEALICDSELRYCFGLKGKSMVMDKFTYQSQAPKILEALEKL